jgi:hypothetical protein
MAAGDSALRRAPLPLGRVRRRERGRLVRDPSSPAARRSGMCAGSRFPRREWIAEGVEQSATSTPSLPCAPTGNWSQPVATVWLVRTDFGARAFAAGCHWLRPLGSIKAPSPPPESRMRRGFGNSALTGQRDDPFHMERGRTARPAQAVGPAQARGRSRTRPFCPSTFRPLRKPTLFERLNFPPYSRSPLAVCGSRICAAF